MGNGIPNLEDFRQQLKTKLDEVRRILSAINIMEEEFGQQKTSLDTLSINVLSEASPTDSGGVNVHVGRPRNTNIRPDEFLGMNPLDAGKRYLRSIRQAAHIDDIATAVSGGGAAIKGSNWKEELEESLLRSTREVVKVQERIFGLTEFYTEEQLKGLRQIRRQGPEPKAKKRRKKRAASRSSNKREKQQTKVEEKESSRGAKEETQ